MRLTNALVLAIAAVAWGVPSDFKSRYSQTKQLNGAVKGRALPKNVKNFYEKAKNEVCTGNQVLASGFVNMVGDPNIAQYCTNARRDVLFLSGLKGKLTNMDVDCDGDQHNPGDGRCRLDETNMGETTFSDTIQSYNVGVEDLNPNFIPYVVLGNESKQSFDPQEFGIEPLSVVAVVCNNKLLYGIWGDTCGSDEPTVGEASLALATACYGKKMNGNSGHDDDDVLFVAFTGKEAVPGAKAAWNATSFEQFENSISDLGNRLIQRLN